MISVPIVPVPDQMPVVAPGDVVLPVVIRVSLPDESTKYISTTSTFPRGPSCFAEIVTAPALFCAVNGRFCESLIASATAAAIVVGVSPEATATSMTSPQSLSRTVNAALAFVAKVITADAGVPLASATGHA